jgi:hypothetical protein
MMRLNNNRCILAIDPTPRGLAFVSFESGGVQDWGTRMAGSMEEMIAALDVLIERCGAEVLIIEDERAKNCRRKMRMRVVLRQLSAHARQRGVEAVAVSREAVTAAWLSRGMQTKYAIASEIGSWFYELEPLVPKPRIHYDIEPAAIHLFDAASLALHAFGVEERQIAA